MANRTQLFINDNEVDLSSDSPVALTFQINDIGNPKNQQGNTSNQFQLPDTERNRKALGFPDDINFDNPNLVDQLPYTRFICRLIQNNIEVLPTAIIELNDPAYDNGNFNVTILSGNVDFFDQIGGQIADMGDSTSQWSSYGAKLMFKPYDHLWNLQNAATSQKNTNNSGNNGIGGWIYPIVDYGLFTEDYTQRIDVHFMRPGFFIKTYIDLLLKFTGFKAKGSLLKNPLYPLLIAQFSNSSWSHGLDYQNQPDNRGGKFLMQTPLALNHPSNANPGGEFHWDTIISDPSNQFVSPTLFKSKFINDIKISVTFPQVYIYGRVTPVPNSTKLQTYIYYRDPNYPSTPDTILSQYTFGFDGQTENIGGNNPNGWTRISGSGGDIVGSIVVKNAILSFETTLPQNGQIYIAYVWQGLNPAYALINKDVELTIVSQNQSVQFGQTVQSERILPETSQIDLLKDTLQRFGVICQTDDYSATITFASLGDIVNNIPIAKDWSSKCLNQGKQVSLTLGSYAQVNYLEYQQDPNNGLKIIPLKYGWSQINVKNKVLSVIPTDLIVSVFGPSLNRPFYGDSVALIQMIDPTDTNKQFGISVAPRILIDQKFDLRTIGKSVTFTDDPASDPSDPTHNITVNDIISVPYFWKPNQPKNMSLLWEDLRLLYYPILERILKNAKKVTYLFLLSARDIAELDLLIPIYLEQDASYYYINKIDAWIENVPVKVELIKLG